MSKDNKAFGKKPADIARGRVTVRHPFQKVAILVDGDFFLRRLKTISEPQREFDVNTALAALRKMMHEHIDYTGRELYRLFFYDCKPLDEKRHLPISKRCLDYSTTPQCIFRKQLHNELKKQRKCALRLGYILDSKDNRWIMKGSVLHDLLNKKRRFEELTDGDFTANIRQKQVDMMIGVDIATLCLKELVDTIVLVSGDGDFVPASKLARREGIDFILDPMHMESQIHEALFEHIDAIHNALQNRSNRKTSFRNTESMQKT